MAGKIGMKICSEQGGLFLLNRVKKAKTKNVPETKKKTKFRKFVIILLMVILIILAVTSAISIHNWQEMACAMLINQPSQVLDLEGEVIAQIGSERNRQNVDFADMPKNLKNAYVAIEDERFYKHFGVDIKRTIAAIGSYVIHLGDASFGASTITQQIVKNLTGDDSNRPTRKVKEWTKAIELEWCMTKDEILESYLNMIYVGPNLYGVQMGATYYFDKNVSDLDLAECAFLAGINHAPNAYNPFNEEKDHSEKIQKRTRIVLNKMLELGNITQHEHDEAMAKVEKGISFKKGKIESSGDGIYSYHTDALLLEVVSDLAKEKNISKTFASNYLCMANAKIHSTQNSEIQEKMEAEFEKSKYQLKSSKEETSQAAMVIMDHKKGQVIGCVGGLGEKKEARGFNRATQAIRQTGSSSKPLAVLIPALDKKLITPLSQYEDTLTTFIDYNNETYEPINYNDYLGKITVRRAVESSQNIPFVKIMEELTASVSIDYLEKMGISTLNEKDENLALSLGGLDKGISPLEMAGAYSTIANDGVYIEPTFYTKITTATGKDIVVSNQKKRRVFSEDVAYVTKQLLTQPVVGNQGTATYCAISGMDVAAKTGTTNEDYDRWLCGFTNYYTAVTWFGFDLSEPIRYNGKNPAGILWSNVMKQVHKKLENSDFKTTKGVVSQKICKKSLKVANSGCKDVFTECFIKGTVPEGCTTHKGTILSPLQNEIEEDAKQKMKEVVKSTVDYVKNEINRETEVTPQIDQNPPQQTPVSQPEQPVSPPNTEVIQNQTEPENVLPEENVNQNIVAEENNNQVSEEENLETKEEEKIENNINENEIEI